MKNDLTLGQSRKINSRAIFQKSKQEAYNVTKDEKWDADFANFQDSKSVLIRGICVPFLSFKSILKRWLYWFISMIFFVLFLTSCIGFDQFIADVPTASLNVQPTFTPTPLVISIQSDMSAQSNSEVALIDAAGLDIAEKRVINVYDRVAPSVVNISTQLLRRGFSFNVVPEDGAGSGFVLDKEGHILTNYHVIEHARRIEVHFSDDTVLPARNVGIDPRNDIAVLKVDTTEELLVPVELGSSTDLQVGQRAIAIGNPFGQFGRTLTTGVISALDRTLEGPDGRTITGIIQTDAAINRGNSGGPLLNSSGQVIGINTAIFSPSGASAGVGFAVPVETFRRLLPDLLTLGRYRHPWLGIRYTYAIKPGLADMLELPVDKGLLLVQLYRDSPLEEAEVRGAQKEIIIGNQRVYIGGDILLAVDGVEVTGLKSLGTFLEDNYLIGDKVTVTLLRDKEVIEIQVILREEPN